jgi:monofunctional biosynthetic peptidoglycan transglycosylase
LKWLLYAFVGFILLSVLGVVIFKFINFPATPIMAIRIVEGMFDGKMIGVEKDWESWDNISKNFYRAAVAAEDARFMQHDGIDWKAVEAAQKYNERHKGKKKRGASTITMQTAKNAFLWHGRNYLRKGMEAYFTILIETIWGKKRILEVYANIVEFGEGLYGVEAASQRYFKKPASKLTKRQAALLAAILPNPRLWNPAKPTAYLNKRANWVMARMNSVRIPKD